LVAQGKMSCSLRGDEGPRPARPSETNPTPRYAGWDSCVARRRRRTIPAGAGSTPPPEWINGGSGDHPRGRGEHGAPVEGAAKTAGPSPRARGAPPCGSRGPRRGGTIPVGAGSTVDPHAGLEGHGDHPRGCGEHSRAHCPACHRTGPSPRVRGARREAVRAPGELGTIPAGAGSTASPASPPYRRWDHPRGHGEHFTACVVGRLSLGPSPRARGALASRPPSAALAGTIPAGRGEH
jgi:hypothetical protein